MITVAQVRATGGLRTFRDDDVELLLGAATVRRYAPGEVLYRQGRAATSCFLVVSGVVELVKEEDIGERLLTHFDPGAIVGQLGLVDRAPRVATLRARIAATVLELTRDVFDGLLASSLPLAVRFQVEIAVATGRQLREASRRLVALDERRAEPPSPHAGDPERAALERAVLTQLRDPVRDLDVPFDVVEVTPEDRVRRR